MQRWVVTLGFLALLPCMLTAQEECPNGGHCKDGQTCCQHSSNGYQCCPFDQAECCGDHAHCCPAWMSCDVENSRCVNASLSVSWAPTEQPWASKSFRMIKSRNGDDDDNICPDQSRCPAEYSCQRALTKYGCCPLAQGIPCSDGKHCCPQGHSCSEDSRSCVKKEVTSTVQCSDGVSECPEESSCCEGADGGFGCCPMPQAVCCDDKIHCCPEGSLCDLETSKCVSVSSKKLLPMWAKFPARRRAAWEDQKEEQHVIAEAAVGSEHEEGKVEERTTKAGVTYVVTCDVYTSCPDKSTCCSDGFGKWNCCPQPNMVCCSNYLFCCPYLMTCDILRHQCFKGNASTPMIPRTAAFRNPAFPFNGVSELDQTKPGPSEQTDSEEEGKDEDDEDVDHRVHCGGHKDHTCRTNYTCCDHKDHKDRKHHKHPCCPLPNATCCDDGKHCCPHNFQCHPSRKVCVKDGMEIPWFTKIPALPSPQPEESESAVNLAERTSDVQCDTEVSCPDNQTCCSNVAGGWSCCPAPQAVCCSDHLHCCPHGTTCDVAHSKCVSTSDSETTPMIRRTPAHTTTAPSTPAEQASNDTCPCPHTETCCLGAQGKWGCCPAPKAVCCSDHEHCCPHGTICDVTHLTCVSTSDSQTTPMIPRTPALTTTAPSTPDEQASNDTCPCSDTETCCLVGQGQWGCCPEKNAVCCSDHEHCCPHGTVCDLAHSTCVSTSDSQTTPMTPRTVPAPREAAEVQICVTEPDQSDQAEAEDEEGDDDDDDDDEEEDGDVEGVERRVRCRGHRNSTCPRNSTCCRSRCRRARCCPLPNAKCCGRGKGCCPQEYKCCHKKRACVKDGMEIPWFSKIPALPSPEPVYGQTESGQSEPTEIEEDEDDDSDDIEDDDDNDDEENNDDDNDDEEDNDDDNDDEEDNDDEDDDGNDNEVDEFDEGVERRLRCRHHRNATCSRNSTCCHSRCRKPYCCPLPNAHCCGRGKGCCPHGYSCCHKNQTCIKDGVEIPWYTKVPALPNPNPVSVEIQVTKPAQTYPVQTEMTEIENYEEDENDDDYSYYNLDFEDGKVHCNSTTSCPGNSICCQLGDEWGCCPHKNGVCCPERKHCCPRHSKCVESGCEDDYEVMMPWFIKAPTLSDVEVEAVSAKTVVCPDGAHCPDQNTCCELPSEQYGCCPLDNAVCCPDKTHCCPNSFTCDPSTGFCRKPMFLELKTVPLTPAQLKPAEENVDCGGVLCSGKCCNVAGKDFCCGKTDVCCPDTCCRANERCTQNGGCISGSQDPWDNWPFLRKK